MKAKRTEQINIKLTADQFSFVLFEAERLGSTVSQVVHNMIQNRKETLKSIGLFPNDDDDEE